MHSTIKMLSVVFFLLLSVVLYPSIVSFVQERLPTATKSDISLASYTKEQTKQISIVHDDGVIELKNEANGWKVASYSASSEKIDALFRSFADDIVDSIVSTNTDRLAEYGIATTGGVLLRVVGPNNEMSILVGKTGPTASSYYVKKEGSNNVYLSTGGLLGTLGKTVSEWRDKQVTNVETTTIHRLQLDGNFVMGLEKNTDGKWDLSLSGIKRPIEDSVVMPVIATIANLRASDFYTDEEATFMKTKKKNEVVLFDKENQERATLYMYEADGYYLIEVNGKPDHFKVASYHLEDFFTLPEK